MCGLGLPVRKRLGSSAGATGERINDQHGVSGKAKNIVVKWQGNILWLA
jgi:hypothetical protein